jgi:GNAT superfamily N-acetyltransferase
MDIARSATETKITVIPAKDAPWDDLQTILGTRGDPPNCQCQRYKLGDFDWPGAVPIEERAARLRAQTGCDDPEAETSSGLVAYLDGEPAGWCAVEPRTAYVKLKTRRVPWLGRNEDKADDGIWAVTCFTVRTDYRRMGVMYALAAATVDYARTGGARAVEGYPMLTEPGKEITWGELHVGSHNAFAAAGYREVTRPTLRRAVMRYDF